MLHTPTLPLLEYLLRPRPPSPDLIRAMTSPRDAPDPNDPDPHGIRVNYTPPPPPPSPFSIFRAITTLSKIYPGVLLRPSLQCPTLYVPLGTTTLNPSDYPIPKDYFHLTLPTKAPPITFGPFHLTIPLDTDEPEISIRGRALPYYEASDTWSTTPNKKGVEYCHPHLASPYLCKGDAETPIKRALKALDYITVCDMVLAVLSNYNHHSPYLFLHCYHPPTAYGLPSSVDAEVENDDDDDDGPICCCCGEHTGYEEDRWCHDDGPYCESCFSDRFSYCDRCSEYAPDDDCRTVTVQGRNGRTSRETWCSSCRSSDCFRCRGCREYFHADLCNHNDHDEEDYCESCYEDLSDEELGLCPECHEPLSDCTCDDEEETPSPDGDPSSLKETT